MRAITRRLDALEDQYGVNGGWDIRKPCHVILMDENGSYSDALAEYMRKEPGKPVAGDDNVMWIQLCSPKFDEAGRIIKREPQSVEDVQNSGPSLADILKQMEAA